MVYSLVESVGNPVRDGLTRDTESDVWIVSAGT